MGGLDILLLTRLGSTTQEDDQGIAVPAEIDPVAGARVYPAFEDPVPTPLVLERLPCSIRTSAVATLAAACAPRRLNHLGIRTAAFGVKVLPDSNHYYQVTDMLPFNTPQRQVPVRESRT